jgi:hypothetical protein
MIPRRPVVQHPIKLALCGLLELYMPHEESHGRISADPDQFQALAIVPELRGPVDIFSAPRPRYCRALTPTLLNDNRPFGASPGLRASPVPTSPNPIQMGFTQRDFGHRFVSGPHPGFRFDLPPFDMVLRSAQ